MKLFSHAILGVVFMISMSQCSSSKASAATSAKASEGTTESLSMPKLQDQAPFTLQKIVYQKWTAGVKGGGSGVHVYITVTENKSGAKFDSIYLNTGVGKIEIGKMGYFSRYNTPINTSKDMTMSGDPKDEYGNTAAVATYKNPFKLQANECVISYTDEKGTKRYYKTAKVSEKAPLQYPSAPPRQ